MTTPVTRKHANEKEIQWLKGQLVELSIEQKELADWIELNPSSISRIFAGTRRLRLKELDRAKELVAQHRASATVGEGAEPVASPQPAIVTPLLPDTQRKASIDLDALHWRTANQEALSEWLEENRSEGRLPVYNAPVEIGEGRYQIDFTVDEQREVPPELAGVRGAFGLRIAGNLLSPRYDDGEVILVHPSRQPRIGNWGIYFDPEGQVIIGKVLQSAGANFLEVLGLSEPVPLPHPRRAHYGLGLIVGSTYR